MIDVVLLVLIAGVYGLLSWDIRESKERSEAGRTNLHQRISILGTALSELTTSTNNSNLTVVETSRLIQALQKDLDAATERLGLVAEVLKPTVVDGE